MTGTTPSRDNWEDLAARLIMLGIEVARDPNRLGARSLPDQRDEQETREFISGLQNVIGKLERDREEMESDPENWKRKVEALNKASDTPNADLQTQLEDLAWDWYGEHFEGLPLDAERVEGEIEGLEPDESVVHFLERNRMGLRRELVNWILSEGVRAELSAVPARVLLFGLWRVLKDLELGARHLAMRPVEDTYMTMLDAFDPAILRASSIYVALHNTADQLHARADREVALARHALRGPSQLSPYLLLLQRCFIQGFDAECVVICRSLLEDSLRYVYDRNSAPPPNKLLDRIDDAQRRGWLTHDTATAAHDVRVRANKLLHDERISIDALDTVDKTLRVANDLLGALLTDH